MHKGCGADEGRPPKQRGCAEKSLRFFFTTLRLAKNDCRKEGGVVVDAFCHFTTCSGRLASGALDGHTSHYGKRDLVFAERTWEEEGRGRPVPKRRPRLPQRRGSWKRDGLFAAARPFGGPRSRTRIRFAKKEGRNAKRRKKSVRPDLWGALRFALLLLLLRTQGQRRFEALFFFSVLDSRFPTKTRERKTRRKKVGTKRRKEEGDANAIDPSGDLAKKNWKKRPPRLCVKFNQTAEGRRGPSTREPSRSPFVITSRCTVRPTLAALRVSRLANGVKGEGSLLVSCHLLTWGWAGWGLKLKHTRLFLHFTGSLGGKRPLV